MKMILKKIILDNFKWREICKSKLTILLSSKHVDEK